MAKIKFCGMTRVEDAVYATELSVDYIGLIFYEPSKRFVSSEQAKNIADAIPDSIKIVAVFVNASQEHINKIINMFRVDVLQFHGEESPEFCDTFNKPYWKVIRVKPETDFEQAILHYPNAEAVMLDVFHRDYGGTGESFDWSLIPKNLSKPFFLAGGLRPDNVAEAIERVNPYGLDTVSGIEASKGVKDHQKMREFVEAVRRAKIDG